MIVAKGWSDLPGNQWSVRVSRTNIPDRYGGRKYLKVIAEVTRTASESKARMPASGYSKTGISTSIKSVAR
jgi:hypothetical protein